MPDNLKSKIVFIAGPTASGKSAAAVEIALRLGGEIINADAMQVYRDLHIVTARPTADDEAKISHHLFGTIDGAHHFSAAQWAQAAASIVHDVEARGRVPIMVGGTGLYGKVLAEGLSPIPDVDPDWRRAALERHTVLSAEAFRDEVVANDPAMSWLPAGDTQRLLRAWEVYHATGKPLSYFQSLPREPLLSTSIDGAVLMPPRETLYARCDTRAATMMAHGAIKEVEALLARDLSPALPVMKALGVPEISGLIRGEMNAAGALEALQQNTRRFAKRQMTWFRNQNAHWPRYAGGTALIEAMSAV